MKKTKEAKYTSPYSFEGRIPLKQAIPMGLQHVLAMFVGNLTPLLIISGACGFANSDLLISLLQNAMLIAGIVTLVQLYAIGPCGGKVPIIMGTSSGFIGVSQSVAGSLGGGTYAYGAILGASLLGGLFEGVLGFLIKPLRKFFPPVVTGTVVLSIGLSLISVGVNSFGGGDKAADYGSLPNLALGFFVLVSILALKHFTKGITSTAAILFGIIAGYIASIIMGIVLEPTMIVNGEEKLKAWVVDWSQIADAAWFEIPRFMPVKLQFNLAAILPIGIMFIVTAVETIGDISGVMEGGMGREATDKELSGGVVCDGLGSSFAAIFGVLPNTSFSQNVGLVTITKVVNRFALALGGMFLIACGLFPKVGALISIMPQPVLGGAAVIMFSSIVISGIQLITKNPMTARNISIVSVALGLGYGIGANSALLTKLPETVRLVFGGSGIVPAAMVAIVMNILLPKGKEGAKNA